jgi:aryl carrier-like protein
VAGRPPRAQRAATATEAVLIDFCRSIAGGDIVADDKFTQIGMNSLQMVQLAHQIAARFRIRLTMPTLYRAVSIARCAALIDVHTAKFGARSEESPDDRRLDRAHSDFDLGAVDMDVNL